MAKELPFASLMKLLALRTFEAEIYINVRRVAR